ncbi:hypothetical protein CC85DRAFT_303141 [Cutaneotrichosporon oleaginosum]|uniref:Uncharacterized protein n=1 Tax=Cutaneotrichosporon oleaginosum TaxID=879819 RepID=A0A0J0XKG1_9TREE|nr:uncharacterized protein CC85DRAFT_303141 [Cutaneotrichosporon oleaginosum]KLT41586.1 hypothetical protein CC85DRAFT_303141 [Cutaneotrichosporon oleaginosum]TXT09352.1 hypothetical protein COLE_03286 [Cutaneotrichosporon oleaginosum]
MRFPPHCPYGYPYGYPYGQTTCHTTAVTDYYPTTINLQAEDADYARAFTESITHPWGAWPSPADLATIDHLTSQPERCAAVVAVLKERLGTGGECAARALKLIPAMPFSVLADLGGEITKIADGSRWADWDTRAHAAFFLPQIAEAKQDREDESTKRKWEAWQSMYGRSRAAWLPPPDDSAFAYPKWPDVECPKEPEGWRYLLVPAPAMRHFESGGVYPWHR